MDSISLYVHVPFCKSKCNYCDFSSFAGKTHLVEDYFIAINNELDKYKDLLQERPLASVFFGGGTPTLVETAYLTKLLDHILSISKPISTCEISIESNPGTVGINQLKQLKNAGFNRLSIGLQSIHSNELKSLGRIHDYSQFKTAYETARTVGFDNINVDLMFGLPLQTNESWESTLSNVVELRPEHLSCYSLKIEEGTPFYDNFNNLPLPEEDDERNMYHFCRQFLSENGYNHYELSNWSVNDKECYHNMNYWLGGDYIGIGSASHSLIDDTRFSNICDLENYIQLAPNAIVDLDTVKLNKLDKMNEFMMLGLRTTSGVREIDFYKKFGENYNDIFSVAINKLISQKLIIKDKTSLRLTEKGLDLANLVFMEFV